VLDDVKVLEVLLLVLLHVVELWKKLRTDAKEKK